MKTITEFSGFTLNDGLKKHQEMVAGGKTAEEAQAGIGEAFKLEGDKLKFFMNALEVAKKRPQGVKRVLLLTLNEGEKAPQGAEQIETHYYLTEFFPAPPSQNKGRGGEREGGRDGGKRGRGGKGGKGRGGDRDRGGADRGARKEGAPGGGGGRPSGAPGRGGDRKGPAPVFVAPGHVPISDVAGGGGRPNGDRPSRNRRPARGPRPAQGPAQASAKPNVKPNVVPNTAATAKAAPETTNTDGGGTSGSSNPSA